MPAVKKVVQGGVWSEEEHDKFLAALKVYPKGPWKLIAVEVGTRSARQVQTHAQKYYEKVARRVRGLRKDRKKVMRLEHRVDDDAVRFCQVSERELHGVSITTSAQQNLHQLVTTAAMASLTTETDAAGSSSGCGDDESFMALLLKQHDALTLQDSSDSEDLLADVDDYYLDFLIQTLSSGAMEEDEETDDEQWRL